MLRALAALSEPGFSSRHNHGSCQFQGIQHSFLTSRVQGTHEVHIPTGKTLTHKKTKKYEIATLLSRKGRICFEAEEAERVYKEKCSMVQEGDQDVQFVFHERLQPRSSRGLFHSHSELLTPAARWRPSKTCVWFSSTK